MIDRGALLGDLRPVVTALENDMRAHAAQTPSIAEHLRVEHARALAAQRTAAALEEWTDGEITQAAVAWVLACVFVRFLEDNLQIDDPLLSGPGARLDAALGRREVYFNERPQDSDREYLLWAFDQVARYPAVAPLYDPRHTPLRRIVPSVDGARMLRELWTVRDPETGLLEHDFTDPERSTRFLGDLYQDLSDAAKKRYALLQTPEFIEEFILDRTLEPALDEFGLETLRMIDPTCGSGHFLIGAFRRLFARWQQREPGTEVTVLAQRALDAIYGVDLNPYATAIARFRLLIDALQVCEIPGLPECPAFKLNLATGDSLLHGSEPGQFAGFGHYREGIAHVYETEDAPELARILGQGYHVVVGNPPYIVGDDSAARDAYRARYKSCKGAFSLAVPFMERFFELARPEISGQGVQAGYIGQITANSFMRREFGTALVEEFLRAVDITALIDASGAFIPGHATPTVLMFGRSRSFVASTLRVLDGIRGEPSQPADPASGLVWQSVIELFDRPGEHNQFIRSSDASRRDFSSHPMTLGVGRDLRSKLERASPRRVSDIAGDLGFGAVTREDEVFSLPRMVARRHGVAPPQIGTLVSGDEVRDWSISTPLGALWPYDPETLDSIAPSGLWQFLWSWRTQLSDRVAYGLTQLERGLRWYEYSMFFVKRFRGNSIAWAEIATHNHFVLDRGGRVFKQTAPLMKPASSVPEKDQEGILGALNSSTACFWLKQVCQHKGVGGIGGGIGDEEWEPRYAFNMSNVADLPLPPDYPREATRRVMTAANERESLLDHLAHERDLAAGVRTLASRDSLLFAEQIALQEELDWEVLAAFGLVPADLAMQSMDAPALNLGERAFEIVLARQVAREEVKTTWFERHKSTPITELPDNWTDDYKTIVSRRIELIESDPDIALIERPEHKRRWAGMSFDVRLVEALKRLVLDRLEEPDLWSEPRLRSISELADVVRRDRRLVEACELIAGSSDVDPGQVVRELVESEAVPFLAAYRHTAAGMRKRTIWERVWDMQREEDAIDALSELPDDEPRHISTERAQARKESEVGRIPVPPRYATSDFRPGPTWRLRGKLDVPKERFISVPGAELGASGAVVGWAGWDERDRARALAARILDLQTQEAAGRERLAPLLAGVLELVPWIHQWHPEHDPEYGGPAGVFFDAWLDGMMTQLGLTGEQLRAWTPPASARGRRRRTVQAEG